MIRSGLALLGRNWRLILMVVLAAGWLWTDRRLADTRQTLANERLVRMQDAADADAAKLKAERDAAERVAVATATYADRLANRAPIILESTKTVERYAQTDAGRVRCRDADRVRSIDMLDAALAAPPAAAGSGNRPVPANAATAAGGR